MEYVVWIFNTLSFKRLDDNLHITRIYLQYLMIWEIKVFWNVK